MGDEKRKKAGVIGWPVSHSLSPRLHGYWLKKYAINGSYEALAVRPEDFKKALEGLKQQGYSGVNITVPHKKAAFELVSSMDAGARRIGAINTIVINADGSMHASNTDGYGFLENLKSTAPSWTAQGITSVVLGAGGAARAVLCALIDDGAKTIRLVNRTEQKAQALADDLEGPIEIVPWSKRNEALDGIDLLVNTTTLGMVGAPPLDLDLSALPKTAMVNDIVYVPLETNLLKEAAVRGNPTLDGLGMLLHQGKPGFAAWFGVMPEVTDDLRKAVLAGM
jgi:shikimate dehydrogenase